MVYDRCSSTPQWTMIPFLWNKPERRNTSQDDWVDSERKIIPVDSCCCHNGLVFILDNTTLPPLLIVYYSVQNPRTQLVQQIGVVVFWQHRSLALSFQYLLSLLVISLGVWAMSDPKMPLNLALREELISISTTGGCLFPMWSYHHSTQLVHFSPYLHKTY